MKLFTGSANKPLAEKISRELSVELSPVEMFIFPDGERRVRITEPVVDEDVILIQSASTPVDQHYMELFFMLDGLKRSGASTITLVIPYFGYQRQDHIFRDGEAVSLEVIIRILDSLKVDRVISVDMHSSRIPDLFPSRIPVSHLSALPLFAKKIKELVCVNIPNDSSVILNGMKDPATRDSSSRRTRNDIKDELSTLDDIVLISPDMGGIRRIRMLSELLGGMPYAATEKNRDLETGALEETKLGEGSVTGKKRAIIVDDMIASGGTIVNAAELLQKLGIEEMYTFATHAVFSSDAPKILEASQVKKIFVTDTVFISEEKKFEKLEILSVAGTIAETLHI